MKRRIFIWTIWIFLAVYSSRAQQSFSKLEIGDRVPEIQVSNIIHHSVEKVSLSDYRGKWLLLDFWSVNCVPCVKAFPKYQKLQEIFRDSLFILPIAMNIDKAGLQKFYEKRRNNGFPINLLSASELDLKKSIYFKLFPIIETGFPLLVWIDPDGHVVAITQSADVNEANIRELMINRNVKMRKRTYQQSFSPNKPFLVDGNGGPDSAFSYRSMITGFSDSIAGRWFIRQANSIGVRLFFTNYSIVSLIKEVFFRQHAGDIYNKKVIVEASDPNKYLAMEKNTSNKRLGMYCYELMLPPVFSLDEAYEIMRQDICRYFRINAIKEIRELNCLVVRAKEDISKPSIVLPVGSAKLSENEKEYVLINATPAMLSSVLNKKNYPLIINEMSPTMRINIRVPVLEEYSLSKLQRALEVGGLEIYEQKRSIEVIVIREETNGHKSVYNRIVDSKDQNNSKFN